MIYLILNGKTVDKTYILNVLKKTLIIGRLLKAN